MFAIPSLTLLVHINIFFILFFMLRTKYKTLYLFFVEVTYYVITRLNKSNLRIIKRMWDDDLGSKVKATS